MNYMDRPYHRKDVRDGGQSYVIVERRGGDVKVTRCEGGKKTVLADVPHSPRRAQTRTLSQSNGFIGDEKVRRKMLRMDAELGVRDCVNYIETHASHTAAGKRVGAYRAEFATRADRNKWLRAHKRFDADASFGDPCPGDFRNKYPSEFQS
jgi:hypothetical protein